MVIPVRIKNESFSLFHIMPHTLPGMLRKIEAFPRHNRGVNVAK